MFSTPEAISMAVDRLNALAADVGGLLKEPQTRMDLAALLLVETEETNSSEGMIAMLADGRLTAEELTNPGWNSKYPTILKDLAVLSRRLDQMTGAELRAHLHNRLSSPSALAEPLSDSLQMGIVGAPVRLVTVREMTMPVRADWWAVRARPWGFCGAGWSTDGEAHALVLTGTAWNGTTQQLCWPEALERVRVVFDMPTGHCIFMPRTNHQPVDKEIGMSLSSESQVWRRAISGAGRQSWFALNSGWPCTGLEPMRWKWLTPPFSTRWLHSPKTARS